MPEPVRVKCKCGWTASVYPGKILSIKCPKCGEKVWIKKTEVKVLAKPKPKSKKVKKYGHK